MLDELLDAPSGYTPMLVPSRKSFCRTKLVSNFIFAHVVGRELALHGNKFRIVGQVLLGYVTESFPTRSKEPNNVRVVTIPGHA